MPRAQDAEQAESALIDCIYDTTLDPSLWRGAMRNLAAIMGGNYAGIFFFDPRARRLEREIANHFPQREEFVSHFAAIDPRNAFGIHQPAGTTFIDADFIDSAAIGRSEFYQDYLLPNDMGHVAARTMVTE